MREQMEMECVAGCGISKEQEKEKTFAQSLESVKLEKGYTVFEIAEKIRNAQRTVEYWLSGSTVPEKAVREHVLAILTDPSAQPSSATQRRMANIHHIAWDKMKGWIYRENIVHDPKLCGEREKKRLGTRSVDEAIARRNIYIDGIKRGVELAAKIKGKELVFASRKQKRRKGGPVA